MAFLFNPRQGIPDRMMNIVVKIKFVESEDKWHMMFPDGTFIQEFYPCENFHRIFDHPDKGKETIYRVAVKRFNETST